MRARDPRAVLAPPVLEIFTASQLIWPLLALQMLLGASCALGELLSLAISSNSLHTGSRLWNQRITLKWKFDNLPLRQVSQVSCRAALSQIDCLGSGNSQTMQVSANQRS